MAPAHARDLLRALAAEGRFTGTPALDRARALCAERLTSVGFTVRELPFRYSVLPARFGLPAVGLWSLLWLAWGMRLQSAGASVAVVGAGFAGLAALIHWLTSRRALVLGFATRAGVNLEATRGGEPRVWLVAHLDSKSQRLPLALRALGATLTGAAWLAGGVTAALGLGAAPWWSVGLVLTPAFAGALLLLFSAAGNDSPGAADNASGVAAVLRAAELVEASTPLGVLITDAEERGLAGAHAWAAGRAPGTAVNCDTIDDRGAVMLLWSGQPPGHLVTAMDRAARRAGVACRARRLPVGVLTDGVALARAGWECATLSRATVGTLARIHTRRDAVERMEGSGVESAALLLAAMAREMC
ncbi:MAG: M28 family peptidase [Gemmatimonadota bacterium]|nr:M28 family peptidase [Gemmatimonadota bacterium]